MRQHINRSPTLAIDACLIGHDSDARFGDTPHLQRFKVVGLKLIDARQHVAIARR